MSENPSFGYQGERAFIPLGSLGIVSDEVQTKQPPGSLLIGNNVLCQYSMIERDYGSSQWNDFQLQSGIAGFFDWWPNDITQRMIAVTKDGLVYRFTSGFGAPTVVTSTSSPVRTNLTIQTRVHLITGGSEATGNPRKLFMYSGNDPIQVISGDGTTRSNIAHPAADWGVGNYPIAGFIHNQSHYAFGNRNAPHNLYISKIDDHEDFTLGGGSTAKVYSVYPGHSEKIIGAFTYKERLYILKYPLGLYWYDDINNQCFKISESFGGRSPKGAIQVIDDMLIANSAGSITSLESVFAQGKVSEGDLFEQLKCYKYMKEYSKQTSGLDCEALYYPQKKLAFFTYRGPSTQLNQRMANVDFSGDPPKVTWSNQDQANCLGTRKDIYNVERPFYGSEDGYLYQMDREDRNVGGAAFLSEFRTPHMDFAPLDYLYKRIGELEKIFDFAELVYEPTGLWPVNCDYFIDGKFVATIAFTVGNDPVMDLTFQLDRSRLGGPILRGHRVPIFGVGKRISMRFYTNGLNQNFKIAGIMFYFRLGGQNNRS